MAVQAFGYIGIGSVNLDDWSDFATNQLGLQAMDRTDACRTFRMDDRQQRLIADSERPDAERYFGWEVADAAALDTLAAKLEAAGVAVKHEPKTRADQRFVKDLISFQDPDGNRLEAFYGPMLADTPAPEHPAANPSLDARHGRACRGRPRFDGSREDGRDCALP